MEHGYPVKSNAWTQLGPLKWLICSYTNVKSIPLANW